MFDAFEEDGADLDAPGGHYHLTQDSCGIDKNTAGLDNGLFPPVAVPAFSRGDLAPSSLMLRALRLLGKGLHWKPPNA